MLVSDDGDTVLKCDYVKWTSTGGRWEGFGNTGHGGGGKKCQDFVDVFYGRTLILIHLKIEH